jgi:NADH dehydrogenase FAD-containing subunit
MTGLKTAEELAEDGNQLFAVEMMDQIAPDAHSQHLDDVLPRLKVYHTDFITSHKLVKITADGIILENTANSQRKVGRIAQAVSDGFDTAWNLM